MTAETRKIMHEPDLPLSATCVRAPVFVSHSVAAHVEFERPFAAAEVREVLHSAPGVVVQDDPAANVYPTPLNAAGKDPVFVGRIRDDVSNANSVAMWISCDNLRKGAALNAIQIAELLLQFQRGILGHLKQRIGLRLLVADLHQKRVALLVEPFVLFLRGGDGCRGGSCIRLQGGDLLQCLVPRRALGGRVLQTHFGGLGLFLGLVIQSLQPLDIGLKLGLAGPVGSGLQ